MGLDLISFGEALTDLVTQGGDRFRALPGGAGWNVARGCAALGLRAAWAGCLSSDSFGDALFEASVAARLDVGFIRRVAAPPLLAVVDRVDPPRYFFIGANSADLAFDPALLPEGWDADLRWAHFGGISLVREPLGTRLEALAQRLKSQGTAISFDVNHRVLMTGADMPRLLRLAALADVVKVSDDDLRGCFPQLDAGAALQRLRRHNPQALWLHTRGAHGASLLAPGGVELHASALRARLVDSVGAGDASVAGLLLALTRGEPHERALHCALANAALACEGAGAVAPTLAQLQARL